MAARGPGLTNRSQVVATLKLVLPLTALGLMSMVFLLADPVDPSRAIDTAEIDVEERARDPRLSGARFAGVTDEGGALTIEAGAARSDPDAALRFQVQDFVLRLQGIPLPQAEGPGGTVLAQARAGLIDRGRGRFEMSGDIRLLADPGYDLTASRVAGLLDRTLIEAEGPIAGQAPVGRIEAGALTVTAGPGDAGGTRLVFRQGVRLLYHPQD